MQQFRGSVFCSLTRQQTAQSFGKAIAQRGATGKVFLSEALHLDPPFQLLELVLMKS